MTPLSDILGRLADRCEQVMRPDRELDAKVADAIGWWPEGFTGKDVHGPDRRWREPRSGVGDRVDCPAFTASVDAAMSLVLEGFAWGAGFGVDPSDHEKTGWAWCGETEGLILFAATPALALTAACLRARAAESEQSS
jgi:hypothetical protein